LFIYYHSNFNFFDYITKLKKKNDNLVNQKKKKKYIKKKDNKTDNKKDNKKDNKTDNKKKEKHIKNKQI